MKHENRVKQKEEEGSGRRAGFWIMTNHCKCLEHWTHPSVFPPIFGLFLTLVWGLRCMWMLIVLPLLDSYPGLPPLLASDWLLSGKAVSGRGEDPGEACPCPAAWPVMHPFPPCGQTDSPQPSPSCACSHPPWEGKGALRKSLAEHPDPTDCPSSCVPHTLCLHRACCRRLAPHLAQAAPPHDMCFPTGLTA